MACPLQLLKRIEPGKKNKPKFPKFAAKAEVCNIAAKVIAYLLACTVCFADDAPLRIMPLGDSITQGQNESYRRPLWKMLQEAGYRVDFVGTSSRGYGVGSMLGFAEYDYDTDHEGHWGWRADEVLKHIEDWARKTKPDIVLMHLGTNDIGGGQEVPETVGEIESIVEKLRKGNSQVTVLLAGIIPLANETISEEFEVYNRRLSILVKKLDTDSARVVFVDQFSGFDAEEDTYDGVHPNERGNQKMAQKWFEALFYLQE